MCGRYFVDGDTIEEAVRIARRVQDGLTAENSKGEISPAKPAPVLYGANGQILAASMIWGFPMPDKKGLIFNARCESAKEKPMFRESLLYRRCVLPAALFYEWDSDKNKVELYKKGRPVLFMAGFYKLYEEGKRFVILTTAANPSMERIHSRMPLLLEEEEIADWLLRKERLDELLSGVPGPLENSGFQESLFPLL